MILNSTSIEYSVHDKPEGKCAAWLQIYYPIIQIGAFKPLTIDFIEKLSLSSA